VDAWVKVILLAVGGALGTNARYWLGVWVGRWSSPAFPWATFAVNVLGSFAIGYLSVVLARWAPHPNVRLLVLAGFLGGFTTFSAFAFDSLILYERGQPHLSLANAAGSVVAALAAVALGVCLARAWH
jgi:fluoride exporter